MLVFLFVGSTGLRATGHDHNSVLGARLQKERRRTSFSEIETSDPHVETCRNSGRMSCCIWIGVLESVSLGFKRSLSMRSCNLDQDKPGQLAGDQ